MRAGAGGAGAGGSGKGGAGAGGSGAGGSGAGGAGAGGAGKGGAGKGGSGAGGAGAGGSGKGGSGADEKGDKGDKVGTGDKKPGIVACTWSHSDGCEEMHRTVAYVFEPVSASPQFARYSGGICFGMRTD